MTNASSLLFVSLLLFPLSNPQAEPPCLGNTASVRYHPLLRSQTKFARFCISVLLAAGLPFTFISSHAEAHCPGNIPALYPRILAGALLVVPVKVNQSGPYDFMVDTGSQFNVVDPRLAAELGLKPRGSVGVITVASYSQASVAMLGSLEAGSHVVTKPLAAIEDMSPIQAADPRIRGMLGENFLAHFDVLLDYRRGLICLDQIKAMERELRGQRVPLVRPRDPDDRIPFSERLVISVNLADTGDREILLQLDSGCDGSLLYSGNQKLQEPLLRRARFQGPEVSEARRAFAVLPAQDMRIGSRVIRGVQFVTPVRSAQNAPRRGEDGILATLLFERVYINHGDHYVMLKPK